MYVTGLQPLRLFVAVGTLLASLGGAHAAGDAEEGHRLALLWCANCHVVDDAQATASADVPPFTAIANSEALTTESLSVFLADPHPVMPDMDLSRSEIADIVAYIESLKSDGAD